MLLLYLLHVGCAGFIVIVRYYRILNSISPQLQSENMSNVPYFKSFLKYALLNCKVVGCFYDITDPLEQKKLCYPSLMWT